MTIRAFPVLGLVVGLVGGVMSCLGAADPGQEASRWGPVPERGAYPSERLPWWISLDGIWCPEALAWLGSVERVAGLQRVTRTTAPIDGQVSLGWMLADMEFLRESSGLYLRPYARLGSDTLAAHGTYLAAAGCAAGYGFLGSAAVEVAHSGDRQQVLSADVDAFVLHLKGEMDHLRTTRRMGFAINYPGGVDGFAFTAEIDDARTQLRHQPSGVNTAVHGVIVECTVQWILETNLHLIAQMSAQSRTLSASGVQAASDVTGSAGIGVSF